MNKKFLMRTPQKNKNTKKLRKIDIEKEGFTYFLYYFFLTVSILVSFSFIKTLLLCLVNLPFQYAFKSF